MKGVGMSHMMHAVAQQAGSAAPAPSCAYPLDASESEVTAQGFDQKLPMSDGDQLATHQFIANSGSVVRLASFSDGASSGSGQTFEVTDGGSSIAVAVDLASIPDLSGGDATHNAGLFFGPGSGLSLSIDAPSAQIVFRTDGTLRISNQLIVGSSNYIDTPSAIPKQLCAYFRWTDVNGSPEAEMGISVLHSDDTTEDLGWQRFVSETEVSAGLIFQNNAGETQFTDGLDVPFRFVTTASEIKCPVPAGAVDPCGTTINA